MGVWEFARIEVGGRRVRRFRGRVVRYGDFGGSPNIFFTAVEGDL